MKYMKKSLFPLVATISSLTSQDLPPFQLQKLPPEIREMVIGSAEGKAQATLAQTNTQQAAEVKKVIYRNLITNLGLRRTLLTKSLATQGQAIDNYLRKNFDITIILPQDPAEYRLYISPAQALDIFNHDYRLAREDLARDGLKALFDYDFMEKTAGNYPALDLLEGEPAAQEGEVIGDMIRISYAPRTNLKAIPPFTLEQVHAFRELIKTKSQESIMAEHPDEAYDEIFTHLWDEDLDLLIYRQDNDVAPQRSPLNLLPRSIWLFNPTFFTCSYTNLLAIPSDLQEDNALYVNELFDAHDNNLRKIPATQYLINPEAGEWLDFAGNPKLTQQPVIEGAA